MALSNLLEEARSELYWVARNSTGGVGIFDANFRYVLLDGKILRERYGFNEGHFEGKFIGETVADPALRARLLTACAAALRGETITEVFELGDEGIFQWEITPIKGPNDQVFAGMITIRDITDPARTQKERELLLQETRAALRVRDHFVSVAAHELKTPLTSVLGYAQMLAKRLPPETTDAMTMKIVNTIVRQSEVLSRMLSTLLDITRIQQGRLVITPKLIPDLSEVVRQIVGEMQVTTDFHRISYDAPETGEPIDLVADPDRVEQIVMNLIANAIKYSPDGGNIMVACKATRHEAIIVVRDEGMGIPEDSLDRIFERFYRAPNIGDNVNTAPSGMGVGLYVVKQVVEIHGGRIIAESEGDRQGSTFTVILPREAL